MPFFFRGLKRKYRFSSVSTERRKKEQDYYLKNGSSVLEELLALCDGNCRIPIRYFTAIEIERAIKHSKRKVDLSYMYMVTGSLDNRLVLVRFNICQFNIHRDIAVTAQMSHLNNVLRLIGCCLEFEEPVMVYAYVEGIPLSDLLFKKSCNINDHDRKSLLSWENRLRIARDVASAIVFLHTEFTTPIINRDLNIGKVIIDRNSGVAKIVDFSLSISLPPEELELQDDVCGTTSYLAPEYMLQGIITQKTDVFNFGVFLFQLLTGKKVCDCMDFDVEEGDVMDRVDFVISEDNAMDSTNAKETTDFEEDAKSNIEQGNTFDRVNYAILEEKTDLPPNFVNCLTKKGNVMDIVDPTILEEHGIEIQQQLKDCSDLARKCTADNGDDRPYMIHVARELCRIDKCFRALTLAQI